MPSISQHEFDTRLTHWFELVFNAFDAYVERMIVAGSKVSNDGDEQLHRDMDAAYAFQQQNLPELLLREFVDHLSPPGYYLKRSRSEALLKAEAARRLHRAFELQAGPDGSHLPTQIASSPCPSEHPRDRLRSMRQPPTTYH